MKKSLTKIIIMTFRGLIYGTALQVFFLSMLLAKGSEAQNIQSVRDATISIDLKDANLKECFTEIEKQTDYRFSYDHYLIDANIKINYKSKKKSVSDLLMEISKQADLKFMQVNNNINVQKLENSKENQIEIIIQGITITGRVTSSEDNEGLPGVNVIVKGTSQGTVTDVEGNFKLDVPDENTVLVFSSVGFIKEEVTVGNQTVIDMVLTPDLTQLAELVVIGYGTQERVNLTGSVVTVDGEKLEDAPTVNITNTLSGRLTGVVGLNRTGEPGDDISTIVIRGLSTLGNNDALVVIDGVAGRENINQIDPRDIESISVLKDASAAIYGARAANGVILITTKRGKSGKPSINFTYNYGIYKPTFISEHANSEEIATFQNLRAAELNQPLLWTDEEIRKLGDGSDPVRYPNTIWTDEVFKKSSTQSTAG
ncbi:MAG: TonB-dependent receptor plug domain-containing protein, partial [Cyclobacteriaceae bacterium]|nr:TonB-dependent receptor plug domain-containing protein [Cyclobacteriaceae bacterium]